MVDEHQPLLRARDDDDARRHRRLRIAVGGALALGVACTAGVIAHRNGTLGDWKPARGRPLLAPGPGDASTQSRYTVHTACKPRELAQAHASFFLDGDKEGYLVKHNYGSTDFFSEKNAIRMTRQKLPSGNEYGYVVDTDAANFEYGFALKNTATGEWLYEIGDLDSPLAKESCTQKYWPHFNRVRTLEENKESIEYVYGSCDHDCTGYVDEAYVMKFSDDSAPIPNCGQGTADLGEGDDARLFSAYHALFVENNQGTGRAPTSRDTTYAESETQARWLVHTIEYGDRSNIHAVALDVKLQGGHIHVCQSSQMNIPLGSQCTYIDCSSSVYDVPSMKSTGTAASGYGVIRLQYSIARSGDPRPIAGSIKFSNAKYLTNDVLYAKGTWGQDIDARRLIPISGGTCGQSIANGHCVGMYTAVADEQFTATASEKRWILSTISGHLKMVRIRVYVQDGALKVEAIRAAYANSGYESRAEAAKQGPFDRDQLRPSFNVNNAYYRPVGSFSFADKFTSHGYGVGALKWMLAPEMAPSLAT